MPITVQPLDAPLGAEILGVDPRRPLDDADFGTIQRALVEYGGIVLPELEEDVDWLHAFGRRFGPLLPHVLDQYHHPRTAEISVIAANMGDAASRRSAKPAGAFWHSDLAYKAAPADAIFLYATRVPAHGGDTLVANMALAYEALPERSKRRIAGRMAVQRYGWRGEGAITALTPAQQAATPDVVHPVVRVHPVSGRKCLFVSPGYTVCIVGMERAESDALLEELFAHALRPEFQYRHRWRLHQLLGLDNRSTMHCAVADYSEPRCMLRMIVGCTEGTPRGA